MKSRISTKKRQRPKGKPGRRQADKRSRASKASRAQPSKSRASGREAGRLAGTPDPLDELIAGAARALDLTIEPTWMPSVRANLRVTLAQAALVGEFALPDETDPAPIFQA